MTELDIGDPAELDRLYRTLLERFPQITVLGSSAARTCATSPTSASSMQK
jgi:NAD(P)-dependent dehydrogenase (short-subunit alcohol dehydrogenase family)